MTARRPSLPLVVINANKLCQNTEFQAFSNTTNKEEAKAFMCARCHIESKKELATNLEAFKKFNHLMGSFNKWLNSNAT